MQRKWIETWHFALTVGCRVVAGASSSVINGSSFASFKQMAMRAINSCFFMYMVAASKEKRHRKRKKATSINRIDASYRCINTID